MDIKVLLMTFVMIFLAELGDKTQLATFTFAAENKSRLAVFIGSAGALVLTSLLAVLFGSVIARVVPTNYIKVAACMLFVVLGVWIIVSAEGRQSLQADIPFIRGKESVYRSLSLERDTLKEKQKKSLRDGCRFKKGNATVS